VDSTHRGNGHLGTDVVYQHLRNRAWCQECEKIPRLSVTRLPGLSDQYVAKKGSTDRTTTPLTDCSDTIYSLGTRLCWTTTIDKRRKSLVTSSR
jgi:hypothetical protein